ncbi:MAG: hypothetical protein ACREX4_25460 [Gammaproteobacteria bacterium]
MHRTKYLTVSALWYCVGFWAIVLVWAIASFDAFRTVRGRDYVFASILAWLSQGTTS